MTRLVPRRNTFPPYLVVALAYIFFLIAFALYHRYDRFGISSLLIIPVIAGSWYFGVRGGIFIVFLGVVTTAVLLNRAGYADEVFVPSNYIHVFTGILVAVMLGNFGTATRERKETLSRLESLHEITRTTLEARNLEATLRTLLERIAKLFDADDAFFAFWDEENELTTPTMAYGSMRESYPRISYQPGTRTLTSAVMETGHPLAIRDIQTSALVSPEVAALLPSRSMLGIPLIIQGKKIASFYLGYNRIRQFTQDEINYAENTAQHIALVLAKIQLLEDAQKQIRQLSVLHSMASIATQVDNIDKLIEHATEIIGKILLPDNFGVLLMDEEKGVLRPHPSYQFRSERDVPPAEIPLDQGITGKVAETGQPIRVGDVEGIQIYVNIDRHTASELCVPIKLKERVLGVINAESRRTNAFSLDDELLLGTLAGQLATAIEQIRTAEAEHKWLDQLAHSNDLIYALAHITTHIEKALTQEEIIATLGIGLRTIDLPCALAVRDKNHGLFTVNYTSLEPQPVEQAQDRLEFPLIKNTFSLKKLSSIVDTQNFEQPAVAANPEREIGLLFGFGRKSSINEISSKVGLASETTLLRLPLVFEENLFGILWIWGTGLTKSDLPIMSIFAKQIGFSLERASLFQEAQSLAVTDPLTGLQNRRSLFELGRIEFARADRMNRAFCCMLLDVDHFKQINDRYGHSAGDHVLYEVAALCKHSVRQVDLLGRYGGEELVIFLPETEMDTARQVAERLRAAIEQTPIDIGDHKLQVTVSIGVSRKDENTPDLETLLSRADQAMYVAKHKGRNQVAVSA